MHHSVGTSSGEILSLMTHHRNEQLDFHTRQVLQQGSSLIHQAASSGHPSSNSPDFRIPSTPPAVVSSSTCSPPAPPHVIMRPPPPPPPHITMKINRSVIHGIQEMKNIQHQEEPSSSIPDLEFDGTTVLCRVCGDKASGFHYGVHSCEGCKGFFRRSIQQKIQYRPCTKNQQCSILRINRNRCQYCRLKKCIAVGMSRDAVRFGRVPKREKARILAAMQQSTNSRSHEKALTAELEDDQRLLSTVVRAHLETCDFTRDKVEPMILQARTHPSFTACPPSLACPLNPNPQPLTGQQELLQDFSKRFSPAIRGVVEFAKRITGFSLLPQDDQVTLLKAGVFEVLLVRLACMFDSQTNSMICLNGQVLKRDSIHNSSNARFLMDSMFDFAERLNTLHLSDAEIGLFSSIVVIAPDRPGLRNTDLIEKMHNKLKALLQNVLSQNHPGQPHLCQELIKKIPDLRTLNTLHSEKLLAFKMTEHQQQLQHQHNIWSGMKYKTEDFKTEECDNKSPIGSSWSSGSDAMMDEVKSPMGSVSSTESMCSGEVASLSEANSTHVIVSSLASNAPLLAATLANGVCPMRHRRHNSGSDDDIANGTIHSIVPKQPLPSGHKAFRKLDSPSDSGIESGTEKIEKVTNSAPTSVCSSPRSSSEDKDEHHNSIVSNFNGNTHQEPYHVSSHYQNGGNCNSIEDMPVLKRVLQAPPLYDTNSLMDEAYKPHKKFRALRNKDTAEAEPVVYTSINTVPHNVSNFSSTNSSIANSHSLSPILSSTLSSPSSASTSPHLQYHLTSSSLSSTHSTLARSLMEGPKMTPEQWKRTDIIHNFIMRGADTPVHEINSSRTSPTNCHYIPPHAVKWESPVGTSVITTSVRSSGISSPYSYNKPSVLVVNGNRSQSLSPPSGSQHHMTEHLSPRMYIRTPNASPSTCSPPLHYLPNTIISPAPSPNGNIMMHPNLIGHLAVGNSQQPLNLSKKTPPSSPSPRPHSANSTSSTSSTTPKIVSLQA